MNQKGVKKQTISNKLPLHKFVALGGKPKQKAKPVLKVN